MTRWPVARQEDVLRLQISVPGAVHNSRVEGHGIMYALGSRAPTPPPLRGQTRPDGESNKAKQDNYPLDRQGGIPWGGGGWRGVAGGGGEGGCGSPASCIIGALIIRIGFWGQLYYTYTIYIIIRTPQIE